MPVKFIKKEFLLIFMAEEKFPWEKILAVSVKDYIESVGKSFRDYEFKGIHFRSLHASISEKEFTSVVPQDVEVVVDYKIIGLDGNRGNSSYIYVYGTALIPKRLTDEDLSQWD